jgi:hypothetical protein
MVIYDYLTGYIDHIKLVFGSRSVCYSRRSELRDHRCSVKYGKTINPRFGLCESISIHKSGNQFSVYISLDTDECIKFDSHTLRKEWRSSMKCEIHIVFPQIASTHVKLTFFVLSWNVSIVFRFAPSLSLQSHASYACIDDPVKISVRIPADISDVYKLHDSFQSHNLSAAVVETTFCVHWWFSLSVCLLFWIRETNKLIISPHG